MHSLFWIAASLATTALAVPTNSIKVEKSVDAPASGRLDWSPDLARFYASVSKHIEEGDGGQDGPNGQTYHTDEDQYGMPDCDLANATFPESDLPPPGDDEELIMVVIGRGTQNYTCAGVEKGGKPEALGALADLFDATCLAAAYPDLLNKIPAIALQADLPKSGTLEPGKLPKVGVHYFDAQGTPVFSIDGEFDSYVTKDSETDAPKNAVKGPDNTGDGAVPWLLLTKAEDYNASENTDDGGVEKIYRLNTAGGKSPATCDDMYGSDEVFTVEYSTQYWFYG